MDVYNSEQEQVEALKKWWKENGLAVVLGLGLGLGGLFGWRYWDGEQTARAEQASLGFQEVMSAMANERPAEVGRASKALMADYEDSLYAGLAALMLAGESVRAGQLDQAAEQLRWVLEHTSEAAVKETARRRLARVLLALEQPDAAWSAMEQSPVQVESAALAELRGDIRLAQGETEAARDLYLRALALAPIDPDIDGAPLQLKLDDLGGRAAGAP